MQVSHSGMSCFPGRIALAITPRMIPTTIAHSQFMSPPDAAGIRVSFQCSTVFATAHVEASRTRRAVPASPPIRVPRSRTVWGRGVTLSAYRSGGYLLGDQVVERDAEAQRGRGLPDHRGPSGAGRRCAWPAAALCDLDV